MFGDEHEFTKLIVDLKGKDPDVSVLQLMISHFVPNFEC